MRYLNEKYNPSANVQKNNKLLVGGERIDPRLLRLRMVREQIEGRGITDSNICAAMSDVPRHLFVTEAFRCHAYDDTPLPIGYGQTISQPFMVAWMTQTLQAQAGMRVLEIGAGSGYQSAILAKMGCMVYAVERLQSIYENACIRLRNMGLRSIRMYRGDGTHGLPHIAPFDRILVSAGSPTVPTPLVEQLSDNGILVIPVGAKQGTQRLLRIINNYGRLKTEDLGSASFVDLVGDHGWKY